MEISAQTARLDGRHEQEGSGGWSLAHHQSVPSKFPADKLPNTSAVDVASGHTRANPDPDLRLK